MAARFGFYQKSDASFANTALPVWVVFANLAIFCMLGLCSQFGRLDTLTS
jgi:hypothetical protein